MCIRFLITLWASAAAASELGAAISPELHAMEKLLGRKLENSFDFQSWLHQWQTDATRPVAAHGYDLTDGGGLGDILDGVVDDMLSAIERGERAAQPQGKWRYATLMASEGLCDQQDGWRCVFSSRFPPARRNSTSVVSPRRSHLADKWIKAQLYRYVWQPNEYFLKRLLKTKTEIKWPPVDVEGKPVGYLGVHVRRGDACSCDESTCRSTVNDGARECFPVKTYLDEAYKVQKETGITHLLLATESPAVIKEVLAKNTNFTIHFQKWDRKGYTSATQLKIAKVKKSQGNLRANLLRIEQMMDERVVTVGHVITSAIVDLELLANSAHIIHGPSFFPRLAIWIARGQSQGVPITHLIRKGDQKTKPTSDIFTNPTMTQLLDPVSIQDFLQNYHGKTMLHVPFHDSKRSFVDNMDVAKLIEESYSKKNHNVQPTIFAEHPLIQHDAPNVRVTKKGQDVRNTRPQNSSHAHELLNSGHSLILQRIQNMPGISSGLEDIVLALASWNFPRININAYISSADNSALNPHSDTTDTLILHVNGSKVWRLCVPTATEEDLVEVANIERLVPHVKFSDADFAQVADVRSKKPNGCANYESERFASMEQCKTIEMKAGDVLYVPKGVVHQVKSHPSVAPSVHLTVSMDRQTSDWHSLFSILLNDGITAARKQPDHEMCNERVVSSLAGLQREVVGVPLFRAINLWNPAGMLQNVGTYTQLVRKYLYSTWEPRTAKCDDQLNRLTSSPTNIRKAMDQLTSTRRRLSSRKLSCTSGCSSGCKSSCDDLCTAYAGQDKGSCDEAKTVSCDDAECVSWTSDCNDGCVRGCDACIGSWGCPFYTSSCDESCTSGCDACAVFAPVKTKSCDAGLLGCDAGCNEGCDENSCNDKESCVGIGALSTCVKETCNRQSDCEKAAWCQPYAPAVPLGTCQPRVEVGQKAHRCGLPVCVLLQPDWGSNDYNSCVYTGKGICGQCADGSNKVPTGSACGENSDCKSDLCIAVGATCVVAGCQGRCMDSEPASNAKCRKIDNTIDDAKNAIEDAKEGIVAFGNCFADEVKEKFGQVIGKSSFCTATMDFDHAQVACTIPNEVDLSQRRLKTMTNRHLVDNTAPTVVTVHDMPPFKFDLTLGEEEKTLDAPWYERSLATIFDKTINMRPKCTANAQCAGGIAAKAGSTMTLTPTVEAAFKLSTEELSVGVQLKGKITTGIGLLAAGTCSYEKSMFLPKSPKVVATVCLGPFCVVVLMQGVLTLKLEGDLTAGARAVHVVEFSSEAKLVVNMANPTQPTLVFNPPTPTEAWDIQVHGEVNARATLQVGPVITFMVTPVGASINAHLWVAAETSLYGGMKYRQSKGTVPAEDITKYELDAVDCPGTKGKKKKAYSKQVASKKSTSKSTSGFTIADNSEVEDFGVCAAIGIAARIGIEVTVGPPKFLAEAISSSAFKDLLVEGICDDVVKSMGALLMTSGAGLATSAAACMGKGLGVDLDATGAGFLKACQIAVDTTILGAQLIPQIPPAKLSTCVDLFRDSVDVEAALRGQSSGGNQACEEKVGCESRPAPDITSTKIAVGCNWVNTNGDTGGEKGIGKASSPEECISMVKAQCPTATTANLAVGPEHDPTDPNPNRQCNWVNTNGDASGEKRIGEASSPEECISMVKAKCPTATTANLNKEYLGGSGECWCQYGGELSQYSASSDYQSCYLPSMNTNTRALEAGGSGECLCQYGGELSQYPASSEYQACYLPSMNTNTFGNSLVISSATSVSAQDYRQRWLATLACTACMVILDMLHRT